MPAGIISWCLTGALLFAGCSMVSHDPVDPELRAEFVKSALVTEDDYLAVLAQIDAALVEAIGAARATLQGQCGIIAYGAKPCGGQWHHLAYSVDDGNPPRARALAELYTALEKELNRRFGRMSDCMIVETPVSSLVGGSCVIV